MRPYEVEFKVAFSPRELVHEPVTVARADYTLEIFAGLAKATMPGATYDKNEEEAGTYLKKEIVAELDALALMARIKYEITGIGLERRHPDGRQDAKVFVQPPPPLVLECGTIDIRVVATDGTVTVDTAQGRRDQLIALSALFRKHGDDALLKKLVAACSDAAAHPAHEFVHLYEVRDALRQHYVEIKLACASIGIDKSVWDRFDDLCCFDENIRGRHRGRAIDVELREPTVQERDEAWSIALRMIMGYGATLA